MRTFVMLCAVTALTACNSAEESDAPAVEETLIAADESAEATAPGTYQVILADGSTGTSMLMEDGTYMDSFGDEAENGTWSEVEGKVCFDPDGDQAPTRCYAIGETAADGSFTATPDRGEPIRVRKLD
jgi:major membrane immunogen (membrane-anchored lipoprotein)